MKTRILLGLTGLSLVFWSCDEPPAFTNTDFIYNPFTFIQDTLYSVESLEVGEADIEWGDQYRAWVGESKYYKSGFSLDFLINNSLFNGVEPDSIRLRINHQTTYPENGSDTLHSQYINFGFYNTLGQSIDLNASSFGTLLSTDTMDVSGVNNYWLYTLPAGTLTSLDSAVSLGVFPSEAGYQSIVYGGRHPNRPSLVYYFHEPDSAGLDSATSLSFDSDTLYMFLEEQTGMFDRVNYGYISQLMQDSIRLVIDLQDITPGTDTLTHIISASLLPAIYEAGSAIYPLASADTISAFHILVLDEDTNRGVNIDLSDNSVYTSNEIRHLIQDALDDQRTKINLSLKPNHSGNDPGFIAISLDKLKSAIYVNRSLAVRP